MESVLFLFVCLSFILWLSYYCAWKHILVNPAFLFTLGFVCQAFYALFFVDEFELDLQSETLTVLILGSLLFFVGCGMGKKDFPSDNCPDKKIEIKLSVFWICVGLFLQIAVFCFAVYFISELPGEGIFEKVGYLRHLNATAEGIDGGVRISPFLFNRMSVFAQAYGLMACYLFIYDFISQAGKYKYFLVFSAFFSFIMDLLAGMRGAIIGKVFFCIVIVYLCLERNNHFNYRIQRKDILAGLTILIFFVGTFQYLSIIKGSNKDYSFEGRYIGVYLSAQIKNLDIFLSNPENYEFLGMQTFIPWQNLIARLFEIPELFVKTVLPFNFIAGGSIGNVYTTYFAFLHDGGWLMYMVCVMFMAFISQSLYVQSLNDLQKKEISISIILYGLLAYRLIFCFFSCQVFHAFLSPFMIETIVYLLVWKFILSSRFVVKQRKK